MQHLDTDNDKEISSEEALAKSNLFLKSQVGFYKNILRSGLDFTNILRAAFMHTDSKSAKDIDNLTVFFTFEICVPKLLVTH